MDGLIEWCDMDTDTDTDKAAAYAATLSPMHAREVELERELAALKARATRVMVDAYLDGCSFIELNRAGAGFSDTAMRNRKTRYLNRCEK